MLRAIADCLLSLLLAALLSACAGAPARPDLHRLYAQARGNPDQPPVILIPGALGTRLSAPDRTEVWPGNWLKMMTSRYHDLALAIDPEALEPESGELRPSGLTERAAGRDYYGRIIDVLESAGGYVAGTPGEPPADAAPRYYVLTYDWRRDNVATARRLDSLIEQLRIDHGKPDLKVDIIGHSMGGLIARYYARYGTADVLDGNEFPVSGEGAAKIRRMVLLGTPNLGSVEAMTALIAGGRLAARRVAPEVMMSMPAIYQLFPHNLHDWVLTTEGHPLARDQFDAYIWKRFELGPWDPTLRARVRERRGDAAEDYLALLERYFHRQLERARRFTWSLTVPAEGRSVAPVLFGGDCTLTPARVIVEEVDGESVLRLWPGEIADPRAGIDYDRLMLEPGDGTVTKASLLARDALDPTAPRHEYIHFATAGVYFLCERHDQLTGNITFQDNLLHTLLSVD